MNRKWLSVSLLMTLMIKDACSGAFSLYTESNGAAVGNFAAGIAAEASDASTGWYNPAGLALIHHNEVVLGGVGVLPSLTVAGKTQYSTNNFFDPSAPFVFSDYFAHLQGAQDAIIPSFHVAHPVGQHTAVGLSIVSPFGLSTHWNSTSAVRYEATQSQLKTINVSPEIGGQLNDFLDGGLGLDFQYADVVFNAVIGSPAVMKALEFPPEILDSKSANTGYSFGMGFHAGLLLHLNQNHTRLGLNYQSAVTHEFEGQSRLTGRLADPTLNVILPELANPNASFRTNTLSSNAISLPSVTTLSVYHDLNPQFAFLASIVYTSWNHFKTIQLFNVAAAEPNPETLNVRQIAFSPITVQNFRNTWRFALGNNYRLTERWMIRMGVGYDQSPTISMERDVRLPEGNRCAASIGVHFQPNPTLGFDLGYTHLFVRNAAINKTDYLADNIFRVIGQAQAAVNLVGAQVVWTMK